MSTRLQRMLGNSETLVGAKHRARSLRSKCGYLAQCFVPTAIA